MTTFSSPRSSKFYTYWDFWFENKSSGNPWSKRGKRVRRIQGDQIRRFFADWAIENLRSSPNLWATVLRDKSYVFIWAKNGLGHIFSQTHLVILAEMTPKPC
jgi:hypothetical protein